MGLLSNRKQTRPADIRITGNDENDMAPINSLTPVTGTTPMRHSPWSSRAGSVYAASEYSQAPELRLEVLVNWIYEQQLKFLWLAGDDDEGVMIKKSRGQYTCCPADLEYNPDGLFFNAITELNVKCAMTVNSRIVKLYLRSNPRCTYVPLKNGLRLQVIPDMSCLPSSQRHQFAAFIADRGLLVVWDDDPRHIMQRAKDIQESLMAVVWPEEEEIIDYSEKEKAVSVMVDDLGSDAGSIEQQGEEKPRRIVLNQAVLTAITLCLVTVSTGAGWAQIVKQIVLDGDYTRLAFFVALPAQIWLSLFFFQALVGSIAQVIGPTSQMSQNSKTFSGVAPLYRLAAKNGESLPHVTVQIPVYKEGLKAVIEPTVHSIKAAISTYEMQGGTANIFINDDGMQLLSEQEACARQEFYEEHNIGWVARPRHDPKGEHGEPFVRRGKFKKASNMNYALWISNRVEDKLLLVNRSREKGWTQEDEAAAYRDALVEVVDEDQGRTWADGNIRVGDYLLLIDSDTRVPVDCFLDPVTEMEDSPQVAIIQMNSGVMNVTDSFFENGITFFTNLVYTQIKFAVANGDVAPFVGHNAIIRWAAVQSIGYDEDDREKFWSEATVSEDFDMALRLQSAGYVLRYASYFGTGFKEGVSLTVYDELARWEKYAYGCNELIFHPLKDWPRHGPFTELFRRFCKSNIPIPSKITIMAYVGTYYALGSSFLFTLMNYFVIGWFNGWLDHYYLDSFKVYLSIIVVFTALGNFALAILRYRTSEMTLLGAIFTNLKWIPLMTIFLGGISVHVSQALLAHMFGIDMNWGATSKEVENTTFFAEVPKVINNFKFTFAGCLLLSGMMAALAQAAPEMWRITLLPAIFPLASTVASHFMLPIVLNPNLMLFTW